MPFEPPALGVATAAGDCAAEVVADVGAAICVCVLVLEEPEPAPMPVYCPLLADCVEDGATPDPPEPPEVPEVELDEPAPPDPVPRSVPSQVGACGLKDAPFKTY